MNVTSIFQESDIFWEILKLSGDARLSQMKAVFITFIFHMNHFIPEAVKVLLTGEMCLFHAGVKDTGYFYTLKNIIDVIKYPFFGCTKNRSVKGLKHLFLTFS